MFAGTQFDPVLVERFVAIAAAPDKPGEDQTSDSAGNGDRKPSDPA
jgi:hypothetical protein